MCICSVLLRVPLLYYSEAVKYKCYPGFHWTGVVVSDDGTALVCVCVLLRFLTCEYKLQQSRPCNTPGWFWRWWTVAVVASVWENIQRLITCPRGVRVYSAHTHTHTLARARTQIPTLYRKHKHTETCEQSRGSMGISDVKNKTRKKTRGYNTKA